jgi:hypothetical protein
MKQGSRILLTFAAVMLVFGLTTALVHQEFNEMMTRDSLERGSICPAIAASDELNLSLLFGNYFLNDFRLTGNEASWERRVGFERQALRWFDELEKTLARQHLPQNQSASGDLRKLASLLAERRSMADALPQAVRRRSDALSVMGEAHKEITDFLTLFWRGQKEAITQEIKYQPEMNVLMRRFNRLEAVNSIASSSVEMMTAMHKGLIYTDLAFFDTASMHAHEATETVNSLIDDSRTEKDRDILMRLAKIYDQCGQVMGEIKAASVEILETGARQEALNGMGRDSVGRLVESLSKISAEIEDQRPAGYRRIMVMLLVGLGTTLLVSVVGGTAIYRGCRAAGRPTLPGGTGRDDDRAVIDQTVNQLLTVISDTLAEAVKRRR